MVHIGADVQPIPELITGFALSFSRSQVDWDGKDEIDGTHTVHFTTAHPYASWSADRWQVWMSGLFGSGDTEVGPRRRWLHWGERQCVWHCWRCPLPFLELCG